MGSVADKEHKLYQIGVFYLSYRNRYPLGYPMKFEALSTTTKDTHCIKFISQAYGIIKLLVLVWFHNVMCLYGTGMLISP